MANANIIINFNQQTSDYSEPRYAPGAIISGTVSVSPQGNINCKHLWVRLKWRTEGRGDVDSKVVLQEDLYQGLLQDGMPTTVQFQFPLPMDPWSFRGHYISIIWEIEVDVDVAWAINPRMKRAFIMAPNIEQSTAADEPLFPPPIP